MAPNKYLEFPAVKSPSFFVVPPFIDIGIFPGLQGGPLMHIIAAKAVCFKEAMTSEFKAYQKQILKNAKAFSEELPVSATG